MKNPLFQLWLSYISLLHLWSDLIDNMCFFFDHPLVQKSKYPLYIYTLLYLWGVLICSMCFFSGRSLVQKSKFHNFMIFLCILSNMCLSRIVQMSTYSSFDFFHRHVYAYTSPLFCWCSCTLFDFSWYFIFLQLFQINVLNKSN